MRSLIDHHWCIGRTRPKDYRSDEMDFLLEMLIGGCGLHEPRKLRLELCQITIPFSSVGFRQRNPIHKIQARIGSETEGIQAPGASLRAVIS